MPTKKQRRRRAKGFRHEYDFVLVDEEGTELPVDPEERRAEREQRASAKPKQAGTAQSGKGRAMREPPQPSWERAFRRGGLMGGLMLLAFIFVFKNGPVGSRIAIGAVYGIAFVPLTYLVDRTAYRAYLRRLERAKTKKS
jgi:hypothetical protein